MKNSYIHSLLTRVLIQVHPHTRGYGIQNTQGNNQNGSTNNNTCRSGKISEKNNKSQESCNPRGNQTRHI